MGDPAPGKVEADRAGWFVRDYFPDGVAPASKIELDGDGTGVGISFGSSSFTTGINMASATISGDDIVLSASGVIMAATSIGFEIAGTSKLAITASGIKLDATVTLDDDGTIADASNITTITQNTITVAGATKINLNGPTDITGILTIDTAGSPADGIKISATTPADGLEISSACSANAINLSAASTTGLLIGGATTEAIDITGNATRAINIDTGAFTSGLTMSAAFSGNAVSVTNSALTVGDSYSGVRVAVTAAAPNNAYGISGYFDATITGTTAGHCYGLGSWINTSTTPVLSAGHIIVPLECGVYTGEAQASARIVLGQFQAILNGAPASLHVFRINTSQTTTAIFAAANAGSIGFAGGAGTTSTKNGDIPIADVVGTGVVYVRTYDAAG